MKQINPFVGLFVAMATLMTAFFVPVFVLLIDHGERLAAVEATVEGRASRHRRYASRARRTPGPCRGRHRRAGPRPGRRRGHPSRGQGEADIDDMSRPPSSRSLRRPGRHQRTHGAHRRHGCRSAGTPLPRTHGRSPRTTPARAAEPRGAEAPGIAASSASRHTRNPHEPGERSP